jgi:signal transduction histidine kinase
MAETTAFLTSLEKFFDSLGIASLALDDDVRTLSWNQEFLRLFPEHAGWIRRGEPYAENLRRFYRARLDAAEMPDIEAHVADGTGRHLRQVEPFEFLHRDRWLRVAVLPLPGLGRLRAWTVSHSSHDGERIGLPTVEAGPHPAPGTAGRSEETTAFLTSLERFLDSLGIASLALDDDVRTLSWNQEFLRLFPEHAGWIRRGEPYAENLRRFYRARLDAAEMPNIEAYVADGTGRHLRQVEPFEFLHRDRWLRVAVLPLPGLGRLRAWTVSRSSHDGERLVMQMVQGGTLPALGIMEQIADGLMVRDAADRIVLANRRFAQLYGLMAPEHAIGRTFRELLASAWAGAPGAEAACQSWADNSRFAGAPFELPLPDDRWVRVRDYRSRDGALFSTHVDVTDLVRLKRSANEAQRRAEELAARLCAEMEERKRTEALTVQLARLAALGEMATGLAHELNQPLAALTLAADTAAIRLSSLGAAAIPEALERLEHVAATAARARDILDHVRLFARAEMPDRAPEPVDLRDAVRGALTLTQAAIRSAGIELETRQPAAPIRVMGHLIALQQMIVNLLMNARDAVAANRTQGGAIRIQIEQQDGEALLTVADNGGGFAEAELQRAFEPFFTTKPPGKGTGIGLSVAYSTVQAMGGTIRLSNAEDGAVVCVRLPSSVGEPVS